MFVSPTAAVPRGRGSRRGLRGGLLCHGFSNATKDLQPKSMRKQVFHTSLREGRVPYGYK